MGKRKTALRNKSSCIRIHTFVLNVSVSVLGFCDVSTGFFRSRIHFRYSELFVTLVVKALDTGDSVLDGSRPDAHLTFTLLDWVVLLASSTCVASSFLNRLIGQLFLGYDIKYW